MGECEDCGKEIAGTYRFCYHCNMKNKTNKPTETKISIPKNISFIPSKYQQDIYDCITTGKGNIIIQAVAGSGKTTTIMEASKLIPQDKKSIFVAFNKSISVELQTKLPYYVQCRTLHSFGLSLFQANTNGFPKMDDDKTFNIISRVVEDGGIDSTNPRFGGLVGAIKKVVMLLKSDNINYNNWGQVNDAMIMRNIDFELNDELFNFIKDSMDKMKKNVNVVSFDDMIWLPVVNNFKSSIYDYVFVDEVQDLNKVQFELIKKMCNDKTRVISVGDRSQCQPGDTNIVLSGGKMTKLKDIQIGDKVVSSTHRDKYHFIGSKYQRRKVVDKQQRNYNGKLYSINCDNKIAQCTLNHKWPIKFFKVKNKWVTYLMKKGEYYRIGQCKLFNKQGGRGFGVWQRCKNEEADAVWILGVYNSSIESKIQERILASNFGLPMLRFIPSNPNDWEKHELEKVFEHINDYDEKATKILNNFNRDIDYPLWRKGKDSILNWKGCKTIFVVEACNLINDCMMISSYEEKKEMNWKIFDIKITDVKNLPVYSLKIETNETYIANGLLTHNSIYAFRGADVKSMDNFKDYFKAKEMPLSICYRCPKSHIKEAQKIVPGIQAFEGNKEGKIASVPFDEAIDLLNDKNLVLCRTNAPLIKIAFALIRADKKAVIRGRDIGKGLIKLINKYKAINLNDLMEKIMKFSQLQNEKLSLIEDGELDKKYKNSLLSNIDSCDTILAIGENVETIEELKVKIDYIFSDKIEGIVCSSIHKAKGLEADVVMIIDYGMMPHPMAKTPEEQEQEMNIKYVALTRSKNELYFLED